MVQRKTVVLVDASESKLNAGQPETLCGVNSVTQCFLEMLPFRVQDYDCLLLSDNLKDKHGYRELFGIEIISIERFLNEQSNNTDVVLQLLGHRIDHGALIRQCSGNAYWPVLGMTHDLFDQEVFDSLLRYSALNSAANDAIVCASASAQVIMQQYLRCTSLETRINLPLISHGVDLRKISRIGRCDAKRLLGIEEGETIFLYFGRISLDQKADLTGLIRCFVDRFIGKNAKLLIAGGLIGGGYSKDLSALEVQIQMLCQWSDVEVRIMPNVDEELKAILFSAADIFVSPSNSLQETFGLTIVEAMLYQLPIVATKWSGYREIITHNKTGFLVDILNENENHNFFDQAAYFGSVSERAKISVKQVEIDWCSFGNYLVSLYEDKSIRNRLGLKGAEVAREKYSLDRMIEKYVNLWEQNLQFRKDNPVSLTWNGPSLKLLIDALAN